MTIQERVNRGVEVIMDIYMKEDYDYVVELAKKGEKPRGIESLEEEIAFVRRFVRDSDEIIELVAEITFKKIKMLDAEIFAKYCGWEL